MIDPQLKLALVCFIASLSIGITALAIHSLYEWWNRS